MVGVQPFKKYVMNLVRAVTAVDYGDDTPRIVDTMLYVSEDGNNTYYIPISQYEKLGRPKKIEVDVSRVDPRTGSFLVKKLT